MLQCLAPTGFSVGASRRAKYYAAFFQHEERDESSANISNFDPPMPPRSASKRGFRRSRSRAALIRCALVESTEATRTRGYSVALVAAKYENRRFLDAFSS